jgi:hypothetical protein
LGGEAVLVVTVGPEALLLPLFFGRLQEQQCMSSVSLQLAWAECQALQN